MHYGEIKTCDIANGPGIRTTLFVSGCRHCCEGCFQPETWDFAYGRLFTRETAQEIIASLAPAYVAGLTLLGGEPFEPENQEVLLPFLQEVRAQYPQKDIWCFTGYQLEALAGWQTDTPADTGQHPPRCAATDGMLALLDVLVDGEFELARKSLSLQFRGSSNQRLIRVPESLAQKRIVYWEDARSLESHMKQQPKGDA